MKEAKDFEEGTHYYLEGGRVVFTALYHLERGCCCGSKCRHCPFDPPYESGNEVVKKEFGDLKQSL